MQEYDVLLFSDHHAHNHSFGSRRREHKLYQGLYNSRLLDACAVLDQITDYLKAHPEIQTVIFGGDMFHVRANVPMDVLTLTHDCIVRMSQYAEIFMLPGNHDYVDREGHIQALDLFNGMEGVHVMSSPVKERLAEGLIGCFVPYSDDKKATIAAMGSFSLNPNDTNIFIGHTGFQGAVVGSDFVLINDSDLSIKEFDSNSYDASFFGHFHKHQLLGKNTWYIGATHQHNWGDVGCPRGFLHAKISKGGTTVKHIESTAPKFVNITSSAQISEIEGNYSKISYKMTESEKEKVKELHSPLEIEVVDITSKVVVGTTELPDDALDPSVMVNFWSELHKQTPEQLKLGLEILELAGV